MEKYIFLIGFISGTIICFIMTIGLDFILETRRKSKIRKHIKMYHDLLKKGFENRDNNYRV